MAAVFRELVLEVSADLVRQCPGLALDVGGSVAKIVYRDKDDWKELQKNKDAKTGKLRLLSCARTLLDEAIAKVKVDSYITRNGDEPTEIFTCGIGCSQFGPSINRELNVKLSNIIEMDCFVKAFIYLVDRYAGSTLLKHPCQKQIDEVNAENAAALEMIKKFEAMTSWKLEAAELKTEVKKPVDLMTSDLPIAKAIEDNMYPCMLAMLGSAFAFMQINKDGSFKIPDGSNRGGRTLLGLGCLLTGAKSYDEIIDMAEKGKRFNVDMSNKAFKKETEAPNADDGSDVYKDMMEMAGNDLENVVFSFGHAVGKTPADFKKEDLADAILHLSIMDTVQSISNTAILNEFKHVFVCGSYAARDYVRELFTKEWERRNFGLTFTRGIEGPKLYFMKQGSHLGALGALINNIEHFIQKDGMVAPSKEEVKEVKEEAKEM